MDVIVLLQALEPRAWFRLGFSLISWCGDGTLYFVLFPLLYWLKSPTVAVRYGYLWGYAALVMTVLKEQASTVRPFLAAPEQVAFLKYPLEGLYWFPDQQTLIEAYRQSPSFPSGHALFAAALGLYLCTQTNSPGWRGLLVWFMIAIPVARLYLGVHYPVDVLAGSAIGLGLGWLGSRASWTTLAARLRRRGWRRWHRQLLLVVMLGGVLSVVSTRATVVFLLLLLYPVLLTLTERPRHRLAAERGTAWRLANAIGGCGGVVGILIAMAPLLSVGSLVSVSLVTVWVTLGCPLLVEQGGRWLPTR
jgi:membrane-associated phospholipid phosphatase